MFVYVTQGHVEHIWKFGIVNVSSLFADKLMKLAEEIVEKENEAQVCAIRIDCSDPKSIKEAFEAVNSLGAVEALVCLALLLLKSFFCHLPALCFETCPLLQWCFSTIIRIN